MSTFGHNHNFTWLVSIPDARRPDASPNIVLGNAITLDDQGRVLVRDPRDPLRLTEVANVSLGSHVVIFAVAGGGSSTLLRRILRVLNLSQESSILRCPTCSQSSNPSFSLPLTRIP